jgi:Putative Flp pilus-assembly TadE/G-like
MQPGKPYVQRARRSQIIVVLAVALPALLGALVLATDIGVLYYNWHLLQSAADSAALAGASYLPSYPSLAISNATAYAERNGITGSEITSVTVSSDGKSLTVRLTRKVPYRFGVLLGLFSGSVAAHATAQVQTAGSAEGITPIGIDYRTTYTAGQVVTLMEGMIGPGNWGPLGLGGTGATNFANNVEQGYQGKVAVGDWLLTEPGVMSGPVRQAFQYLIDQGTNEDPGGTFSNHTRNDPRVLIVPMVDFSNINGASQVPVKGFAALWLVGVNSKNDIQTYFISEVAPRSTPDPNAQNFGAYKAILIE